MLKWLAVAALVVFVAMIASLVSRALTEGDAFSWALAALWSVGLILVAGVILRAIQKQ